MVLNMPYFRRHALSIALLAAGVVFIAWNIPQLSFLLYPFRLFVTFIHESGHSLMAVFTGGGVDSFQVFGDGTGLARTIGGNRFLILPAGYLGAAFFGAALFYLVNTVPFPRKIALGLGTIFILISLFLQANGIALVIGILTGLALIFLGLRGGISANIFVLNILAILTGLNAVLDAYSLARNSSTGLGNIPNDAAAFAALTPGIPTTIWAIIWAFLAVMMVGTSVWYSVIRPMRRGE
jgi:Peptidase M50B-like